MVLSKPSGPKLKIFRLTGTREFQRIVAAVDGVFGGEGAVLPEEVVGWAAATKGHHHFGTDLPSELLDSNDLAKTYGQPSGSPKALKLPLHLARLAQREVAEPEYLFPVGPLAQTSVVVVQIGHLVHGGG